MTGGRIIRAADLFCGGGGTSTGLARAANATGARVDLVAVNHRARAVETHAANFPDARHYCARIDVSPFLLQQQSGGAPRRIGSPAPTVSTKGAISLVQPGFLVEANHGEKRGARPRPNTSRVRSIDRPLQTVTATSRGIGLVEPAAFIVKTSHKGGNGAYVRSASQPLYTVTTAQEEQGVCQPFVVRYNRTGRPRRVSEPLVTLTAKPRVGLVERVALDIHFRMLQPHELAGAMGFPAGYQFTGNKSEQVRQIGNAVCVGLAQALCASALVRPVQREVVA